MHVVPVELALVLAAVRPNESASAMLLAVGEVALEDRTVHPALLTLAMLKV
eukprot:CAMPEP_0117506516 /NCGR_PEP_ID=MMETSP0784-20121206/25948_1 /TAXON_ID=39447 /ORGANISM="" /LENGTH=50 /DNA_ID=CAMNT_0005301991 /DNA_START=413 /DNA_END=565 /DNA_ORIENTATION=+